MNIILLILSIILLATSSVLTYLIVENNKHDPNITQCVLYGLSALVGYCLGIYTFVIACRSGKTKRKGVKFSFKSKGG